MRKLLLVLFTITTCAIIAQNTPKIITGTVFIDSIATQDVHIINKKLTLGAVSNENGRFEILASENNTLLVSHLNLEFKEVTITQEHIKTKNIVIFVDSKTHMLDEVVLEKQRSILEIDPDILNNAPVVNAKTLKLPYANVIQPKGEKTVKIESGLAISVTGLINALNGTNKRKKQLKKITIEDRNIEKIRKHFTDGFFIRQLKIKKENINQFLQACISKGIINLYNKDKVLELTAVLIENSKSSPYLLENETIRVTKK
ncbi:carboxypeptidase-like regulatory domain-containing protein [Tenacibaculum sp. 1_MG-2023]|uniref:carboxypeptidase-like regulatory domain-containing protein n=1 Tax=Tenacibaculum sp. 1_MG-2023 TaxID=3062653 RepID=UPI0026E42433|nr:carboxypeptidase-like regulatory domain-containing protein [Tenacibaculum sp. 1_MG-2023]MDO6676342.1 carboxypeptidase-like regulatory domain-containing protein [Tenacibaculum sp. 1_MG-2023]